ncbi:MAG TPA: AI-2E family transporter [Streptosporangiaceae bacterium]|jgi:predicted PurR-regulated permease PerM
MSDSGASADDEEASRLSKASERLVGAVTGDDQPFGRPGRPLRAHPFLIGFTGALGAFSAWFLVKAVQGAQSALVLIVVSLFLAIGLNPAVEFLQRRGLGRRLAIGAVFLVVIAFFVVFGYALVPPLVTQTTEFVTHVPDYVNQLQHNPRIAELDQRYQILQRLSAAIASANIGQMAVGGIVGAGKAVFGTAFSLITVLILTLYFLGSLASIKEFFYRMVPSSRRSRTRLLGDAILVRIGGYVGGQLAVALCAGICAFVFLTIAGAPYALALAVVVAITDLVPLVGATVGGAIVTGIGLLTSVRLGISCLVFVIAYQQFENYVIYPRVMKHSVNVPPSVTIIAALIGGALLGIVGALIAIPAAAALLLIMREVVFPRQNRN